jgi:hypothetical protein
MSRVLQFLAATASYDPGDAWSDHGVGEAIRHFVAFSRADWQTLSEMLPSLPDDQVGRIAYALTDGPPEEVCPLLVRIIRLERDATSIGACDSLRAMLERERKSMTVSKDVLDYIARLCETVREPWRTSCFDLLRYLSPMKPA